MSLAKLGSLLPACSQYAPAPVSTSVLVIPSLTSDRIDVSDASLVPPSFLRDSNATSLEITLPQRLEYPNLVSLRQLALRIPCCNLTWQAVPSLYQLHSLELRFLGRPQHRMPVLVDFGSLPSLKNLYVNGDVWAGLTAAFTGHSHGVETCVLRGRLVITSQLNDFFSRVATVKSMYCYGSHFVGQVDVCLDRLEHFSLHRVICTGRRFPLSCLSQIVIPSH